MCRSYSQRPSRVLGIHNLEVALDFDLAMANVHRAEVESRVGYYLEQGNGEAAVATAVLG